MRRIADAPSPCPSPCGCIGVSPIFAYRIAGTVGQRLIPRAVGLYGGGLSPAAGRETIERLTPKQNPQRRRIRLAAEGYADIVVICSITIAVKGRPPVVACPAVAAAAVDVLRRHAAAPGVPVYAWGVTPDHVHLMLGASPTCDIGTFVGHWKNLAQREAWRRGIKGTFWQTSFWDHCLPGDERFEPIAEDVLNNPGRAGLVERWCDYRDSGSSVFGLADAGGGQAPALRGWRRGSRFGSLAPGGGEGQGEGCAGRKGHVRG